MAAGGEQVCPHLAFLPSLVDLLGGPRGTLLVGSESSTPPCGSTLVIGTFTSLSKDVIAGCIATGSERY